PVSNATLPANRCAVATNLPPEPTEPALDRGSMPRRGAAHRSGSATASARGHNLAMADPNARTSDLETALRTTGAVREFTDRPVTRDEVAPILDVARLA